MSEMHRITTDTTITTELVNELELALLASTKDGEEVRYFCQYGQDHTAALKFGQDLVDRLRARGLTIKVATRRTDKGIVLLLTDVTPARPAA